MIVRFQNNIIDTDKFAVVEFKDGVTWKTTDGFEVNFCIDNATSGNDNQCNEQRCKITQELNRLYWYCIEKNTKCLDLEEGLYATISYLAENDRK